MINGIHFLLTYKCNFTCDHCFLYCSPKAEGVFEKSQLMNVLEDTRHMPSVGHVFFEGGEPFIFYDILLTGIKKARELGLEVGIVTNAFWAKSEEKAYNYLKPLKELGISSISLSDDTFHYGDKNETPPKIAHKVCEDLGISNGYICIDPPKIKTQKINGLKGAPIVGGGTVFKGRAVDKLTDGLPVKDWETFDQCPKEEIKTPGRIHLDPFGNVFICQGIAIGNINEQPLSHLIKTYQPEKHPILGPLYKGGPAMLAKTFNLQLENEYIEPCHLCYVIRRQLRLQFEGILTPSQIYGVA